MNPTKDRLILSDVTSRPCFDCPARFAREMRMVERCNGSCPGDLVYVGKVASS